MWPGQKDAPAEEDAPQRDPEGPDFDGEHEGGSSTEPSTMLDHYQNHGRTEKDDDRDAADSDAD